MDHEDLKDMARNASESRSTLIEMQAAMRQLQERVERHALVIQVLKDMLLAGNDAAEGEFLDRLEKAAAEKPDKRTCRKCGKVMSPKHRSCIYCGEARPADLL
jgi:hypothetical protein